MISICSYIYIYIYDIRYEEDWEYSLVEARVFVIDRDRGGDNEDSITIIIVKKWWRWKLHVYCN